MHDVQDWSVAKLVYDGKYPSITFLLLFPCRHGYFNTCALPPIDSKMIIMRYLLLGSVQLLRNLSVPRTSPTSSCHLTDLHMFPSRSSSLPPAVSMISPLSSPTPHSLRWNSILVSFSSFLLFHSAPPLIDLIMGFHSYLVCFPL